MYYAAEEIVGIYGFCRSVEIDFHRLVGAVNVTNRLQIWLFCAGITVGCYESEQIYLHVNFSISFQVVLYATYQI